MNKNITRLAASFLALQLLNACDSPSGLVAQNQQQNLINVRANLVAGASAQSSSTVQISDLSQLPEALRNSSQLRVIFDASRSTVQVQRNADGSLSFPLLTSRSFGSGSSLSIIMVGDNGVSYPIQLLTGTPLQLAATPLEVSPNAQVTLGTRVALTAKLASGADASRYSFTWEAAPSAAGPFQGISGNGTTVEWQPPATGSYYIRLGITDNTTRNTSGYLSPSPVVYVQNPNRLAETVPAGGSIVAGEELTLKAALPEYKGQNLPNLQWFFASSAQGPFQPIATRGSEIRWEPPAPGAYYLRLQLEENGRLSTYTSTQAEVLVAAPDEVIVTDPVGGSLVRGQSLTLSTTLPELSPASSYSWFYGFSPAGPFTPLAETGRTVRWTPPLTGEFYLRLRTFDPNTNQTRTYTSSTSKVSVRDSNNVFSTSPSPANLRRGDSVSVTLTEAPSEQVSWSYGSNLQAAFTPIPDSGKTIRFAPAEAGSFYLRATATRPDGTTASFTSADPLIFVAERSNVIQPTPVNGNLELGSSVSLRADVSESGSRYAWSYSTSQAGPFTAMPTLETSAAQVVTWYPPAAGSYFVKVDISNPSSLSTVSFTSSEPVVRVSESTPFFSTDPVNGRIRRDDTIRLRTNFNPGGRPFNYGWAYSSSTAGPFTPIGGSSGTELIWNDRNKPTGTYYIRFQATSPGADRTLNFVSAFPVVFISTQENPGNEFGVSGIKR